MRQSVTGAVSLQKDELLLLRLGARGERNDPPVNGTSLIFTRSKQTDEHIFSVGFKTSGRETRRRHVSPLPRQAAPWHSEQRQQPSRHIMSDTLLAAPPEQACVRQLVLVSTAYKYETTRRPWAQILTRTLLVKFSEFLSLVFLFCFFKNTS